MLPKPSVNPRAALLVGALAASPTLAQTTPVKAFDLEQVSLSPGGQHSLLLSTGDILAPGDLRLSLAAQYQRNPLVFVRGGVRQGAVIGRRFSGHLGVAYGLTDDVEVALQLPVILSQAGDDLSSQGIAPVAGTVLGAPLLQGRIVLARQSPTALGDIGLNLALSLPLGSSTGLSQDPGAGLAFNAGVGFGHDFGSLFRVGAEAGAVVRRRERLSDYSPRIIDQVGSYLTLGVTATTLGDGLRGEVSARALIAATQTMSAGEVMVGARYPLPRNLEVFALAGPGIGKMPGNPSFRAFAGLSLRPFPKERVKEQPKPLLASEPAAAPICPPAPPAPQCPPPPPPPPPDSDHDGIPDAADACPEQAGDAAQRGCPPPPPPPAPTPPPEDKTPKLAELKGNRIEIRDQVRFTTSKSQILAESFPLLDEVAQILKEHPELARLEISGHTDSRGARDYNIKLSQDRAEAVRLYLIQKGVEPSRLVAKGYGPDQPIASNDDAEGRQKNRRTEFHSVSE
ncbi:MAG TPA: OmpA family protein [Archangium sp.]|uniref:OmpA family protein n=1 Tax=Archangium sp. TaxID=1872627 RepID=UPI002EDB7552